MNYISPQKAITWDKACMSRDLLPNLLVSLCRLVLSSLYLRTLAFPLVLISSTLFCRVMFLAECLCSPNSCRIAMFYGSNLSHAKVTFSEKVSHLPVLRLNILKTYIYFLNTLYGWLFYTCSMNEWEKWARG